MVISCSAPGCSAKKDSINNKTSVQFHRFPLRKPDVLAKWVKAMKCANFKPTATSYLCSAHFANSDYDPKSTSAGKHLKPNAVPSYFEKKRPGRKKKVVIQNDSAENVKMNADDFTKVKESEGMEEEYLQVETDEKVETNLAEIIGDREKGTLQVLIVGEDGKITNSEYIFKKEVFCDDEFKVESDGFSQGNNDSDIENCNQCGESPDDKSNQTNSSSEITAFNYSDFAYKEKINKLESRLISARKKIKLLQMNCKKVSKQNKELKLLLKLLVLKRGRGEKNLKQLLEEYERCDYEEVKIKVKEEDFYAEN